MEQIFGTERAVRIDSDQSPDDGIPDFLVNDELDSLRLPETVHSSLNGDIFEINVALDDCLAADSPDECTDAIVSPPTTDGIASFINVSLGQMNSSNDRHVPMLTLLVFFFFH